MGTHERTCLVVALATLSMLGSGCGTHGVVRGDRSFSAVDYLKTAYDTLALAETDTEGHRIRAQRETRAALQALTDFSNRARLVPFDGPPSLAVALELLERCDAELAQQSPSALEHTRRAAQELRAVLYPGAVPRG